MSLAARLWVGSADLAAAAEQTAFVRGVADGTLPRSDFAGYVAQDAHFLVAFARAYALALAAAPDADTVLVLADLVHGVRLELGMHAAHLARWGGRAVDPAPATLAYTDFLLATAATSGLGATCAAMTPCMRLYAWLGGRLAPAGPYGEWVRAYADPAFAALAEQLEALLDRFGDDGPAVRTAYRRAMQLEVAFFQAATGGGPVRPAT